MGCQNDCVCEECRINHRAKINQALDEIKTANSFSKLKEIERKTSRLVKEYATKFGP